MEPFGLRGTVGREGYRASGRHSRTTPPPPTHPARKRVGATHAVERVETMASREQATAFADSQMPLAHGARAVPTLSKRLAHRELAGREPARESGRVEDAKAAVARGHPEADRKPAGHQSCPRRRAHRISRNPLRKPNAVGRELVNGRRLESVVPIGRYVAVPHVVNKEDDHVWRTLQLGVSCGLRDHRRERSENECRKEDEEVHFVLLREKK